MKNKLSDIEVAKLEKAIKEKYGEESIQNPKSLWTEEKEKEYLSQVKKVDLEKKEKIKKEREGFSVNITKNKFTIERRCPTCQKYSFNSKDDLYMLKFDCCFECYIQYVEHREERWNSGWRPNN